MFSNKLIMKLGLTYLTRGRYLCARDAARSARTKIQDEASTAKALLIKLAAQCAACFCILEDGLSYGICWLEVIVGCGPWMITSWLACCSSGATLSAIRNRAGFLWQALYDSVCGVLRWMLFDVAYFQVTTWSKFGSNPCRMRRKYPARPGRGVLAHLAGQGCPMHLVHDHAVLPAGGRGMEGLAAR